MVAPMYDGDSFFTLGVGGQVGLVLVSLVFAAATLGITRLITFHRPYILRPFVWAVLFITYVWVSPQGYYTYYRMIFDGLPAQSVIGVLPRPEELLGYMTFTGRATLSAHGIGVLGWLMLGVALLPRRKASSQARHSRRDAAD